jgi:hypothetical protein
MAADPTMVYDQNFSDSTGTGGQRVWIDYRMQLIRQRESAAPFLSLMLNINSEPTLTHEFRAFETRPNPKKAAVSGLVAQAGTNNGTVTVNVATGKGSIFNVGDIVIGNTTLGVGGTSTNVGIITAISTDALTVRGNDTALKYAGLADGEILQVWGNSFAQGTLSAKPSMTKPNMLAFYTQIFKNSYKVTKTHANNRLYGSPERDRLRAEKEIEHMIEIEKALLRGDGILDTTNASDPRTTMKGLINQISSNVLPTGGTLTPTMLFDFMTQVHKPKYATDGKMSRRLVICSADILNNINTIANANRRTLDVVTSYGMDVSKMVWAGRTWDFIEDPVLSDFLPGYAIIVHPRYVKLREFRPTVLEANIQAPDEDAYKDQFFTELGLEVQLEELHGLITP